MDRENFVGVVLLAFCAVVAGVLIYAIATGERFRYTGPTWLAWVLGLTFVGAILYGMYMNMRGGRESGGRTQWPAPQSGRRSWWRRLLGRND